MAEYNMQCPMAAKRLIYSGLPATVEHGKPKCAPAFTVQAFSARPQAVVRLLQEARLLRQAVAWAAAHTRQTPQWRSRRRCPTSLLLWTA